MGMPTCLWNQNKVTDTDKYRAEKLSPLQSMQVGKFNRMAISKIYEENWKYTYNHSATLS